MRTLVAAVFALTLMPQAAVAAQADDGCVPVRPVVTQKPAATRAPASAPVEEAIVGPRARTVPGAVMRGSPVLQTADSQNIPNGTLVRLVSPLKNTQGAWWFVTARGIGGGWVRDVELYEYAR